MCSTTIKEDNEIKEEEEENHLSFNLDEYLSSSCVLCFIIHISKKEGKERRKKKEERARERYQL